MTIAIGRWLLVTYLGSSAELASLTTTEDFNDAAQTRSLKPYAGVITVGDRVYDGTNQTTTSTLKRVIPNIFTELFTMPMQDDFPDYWSIAFVKSPLSGDSSEGGGGNYLSSNIESQAKEESSGGVISDAIKQAMIKKGIEATANPQPYEPTDDYLNALFTYPAPIMAQNKTTHVRFVEIPNHTGAYTEELYSYGLSKASSFGANYNITGLFLGSQGNLQLAASPSSSSIGSASHALRASFTDSSRRGRIVDFYVDMYDDGQSDVYLAVDGRSYGHAFNIPASSTSNPSSALSLLPAVRFDVKQTMAVCVVVWRPVVTPADAPYRRKQAASGTGLTGEWIVPEDRTNAGATKPKVIIRINDGASELSSLTREVSLSVSVVNILKVKYKVGLLGQILTRSPVVSTRMGGSPEMMAVESNIVQLLQCAEIVTINDRKQLLIKCADGSMKQVFDSYVDTRDSAITLNPWL